MRPFSCQLCAILLSSLLLVGCVSSQPRNQVPFGLPKKQIIGEDFSKYVQKVLEEHHIKGLSLGIVKANVDSEGNAEFGSWGMRTEDEDAVDSQTLFSIGSCSKAFLATSLGLLMDDFAKGKNVTSLPPGVTEFSWESKIADLLPGEWKLKDKWASEKANVRDILSHVSGLLGQDIAYAPDDTEKSHLLRLRYLDTALELRQESSYNNAMYVAASYILSTYANRTFHEFALERIFEPLGMTSTTTSPTEAEHSGLLSHAWSQPADQEEYGRRIPYWFSEETQRFIAGAGGVISSAQDMVKWLDVLLHRGVQPSTNRTIIPESVFDAVTTSSAIVNGVGSERESIVGYGLGWGRYSVSGHELVTHTGGLPGFLSVVAFFPHDRLGVVSLTNTDEGFLANSALLLRIIEDYFATDINGKHADTLSTAMTVMAGPLASHPKVTNKPSSELRISSDALLGDYAGTYANLGYGNVTLCASDDSSPSEHCAAVLRDFALVDNAAGRHNGPQLLVHWPRVWYSHIRIIPDVASNVTEKFSIEPSTLFTKGFGNDESPWQYLRSDYSDVVLRFVRAEDDEQGKGRVIGFAVCGIAGREENHGNLCKKFAAGEDVQEGWLVQFEKVNA